LSFVTAWNDKIVANYLRHQLHQQLGTAPRDEDPGVEEDPDAGEGGPADDHLERFAGDPAGEEGGQLG
jgi:hypothetical protein